MLPKLLAFQYNYYWFLMIFLCIKFHIHLPHERVFFYDNKKTFHHTIPPPSIFQNKFVVFQFKQNPRLSQLQVSFGYCSKAYLA